MTSQQPAVSLKEFCAKANYEKYLKFGKDLATKNVGKSFSLLSFGLALNSSKKEEYYQLYVKVFESWSNKLIESGRVEDALKIFEVAHDLYPESKDLDYLLSCTLYRRYISNKLNMAAETWKVVFRECFGGKGTSYCNEIWPILIAVDQGIKPSFLWDVCTPDTNALLSFLHISYQKGLLSEKLRVLEVDLDVFIVNMDSLIRVLTQILTKEESWLVDISESEPKIPSKDVHVNFKSILVSLLSQLGVSSSSLKNEQKLKNSAEDQKLCESKLVNGLHSDNGEQAIASGLQTNNQVVDKAITVSFPEEVNLSTLFGCILGYPQIYWWQGEAGGNSLSGVPLKVFKFSAFFSPNSSSVELFSFSIPEALEGDLRPGVERWGNVSNYWVEKSSLFTESKFTCDPVLCLSVAL